MKSQTKFKIFFISLLLVSKNLLAVPQLTLPEAAYSFTMNQTATSILASCTGAGTTNVFSITPALPTGLILSTSLGQISGKPTILSADKTYTLKCTRGGSFATLAFHLKVVDLPPQLSYSASGFTFFRTLLITSLNPTSSGGRITSYSVSPSLPAGLVMNATTGVVSGTPTTTHPQSTYTIRAANSGGEARFDFSIQIFEPAPKTLAYSAATFTFFRKYPTLALNPTTTGGKPSNFSVSPALPEGIQLNPSSGQISGTPQVLAAAQSYLIVASNGTGSVARSLSLSVVDKIPSGLLYSPNTFEVMERGSLTISAPRVIGQVNSFSISPALPAGLTFDATTGAISGTAAETTIKKVYTVRATNNLGSASTTFSLWVKNRAPLFGYTPSFFQLSRNVNAPTIVPTLTGGAIATYSVAPALPVGLRLDPLSGIVSGRPTAVSLLQNYIVTGKNETGQTTAALQIQVINSAVSFLSYGQTFFRFAKNSIIQLPPPTITGSGPFTFSVAPALPTGVLLNGSTGVISGRPTLLSPRTSYTITLKNAASTVSLPVEIEIFDSLPVTLRYAPSVVHLVQGIQMTELSPQIENGELTRFSISPVLLQGVSLNAITGVISGLPVVGSPERVYTVTAYDSLNRPVRASFRLSVSQISLNSVRDPETNQGIRDFLRDYGDQLGILENLRTSEQFANALNQLKEMPEEEAMELAFSEQPFGEEIITYILAYNRADLSDGANAYRLQRLPFLSLKKDSVFYSFSYVIQNLRNDSDSMIRSFLMTVLSQIPGMEIHFKKYVEILLSSQNERDLGGMKGAFDKVAFDFFRYHLVRLYLGLSPDTEKTFILTSRVLQTLSMPFIRNALLRDLFNQYPKLAVRYMERDSQAKKLLMEEASKQLWAMNEGKVGDYCFIGGRLGGANTPSTVLAHCSPELVCFNGVCRQPLGSNALCNPNSVSCGQGLICESGRCAGPIPQGGPCGGGRATSCAAGLFCSGNTGVCSAPLTAGQFCSNTIVPCMGGLSCISGTCLGPGSEGESCSGGRSCRPSLICTGAVGAAAVYCRSRARLGETCGALASGLPCLQGLYCTNGTCANPGQNGESCVDRPCADGLQCVGQQLLRVCLPPGNLNDFCGSNGRTCQANLFCSDGVCRSLVGLYGFCSSSSQCQPGLVCTGSFGINTCQQAAQFHENCSSKPCASGLVCGPSGLGYSWCDSYAVAGQVCFKIGGDNRTCAPGLVCQGDPAFGKTCQLPN